MAERVKLYKLYKRGEIWWAYFSVKTENNGNHRFRCSCGTTEKREAELFCTRKISQIQTEKSDKKVIGIDEAFGLFFQNHARYYARPAETLRKLNLIKSKLPIKYLNELDSATLSAYINQRKQEVTNSTINRELVILSSLLTKFRLWKYETSDLRPCQFKLKEPAENIKYLKDWSIAEKIITHASPHLKPIIYTALYTGLRRGNILNLKWEEVDFTNNIINLKVKDRTKDGGKNLSIPMIDKLREILQRQPRINEYVFNYNGHHIEDIKHSWHGIFYDNNGNLKDPELPYVNFHTLRHTAATWILKKTNNLKITQQILGHANITTTLKYAHVMDEEKRKALNEVFS